MTATMTRGIPAPGVPVLGPDLQLERWMRQHADPAWKHKPFVVPAPSKPPRLTAKLLAELGPEHEFLYSEHHDRRECTDASSIEEFMERKRDQKWKHKPYVAPKPASMRLTEAARKAEEKRIRAFVTGR